MGRMHRRGTATIMGRSLLSAIITPIAGRVRKKYENRNNI